MVLFTLPESNKPQNRNLRSLHPPFQRGRIELEGAHCAPHQLTPKFSWKVKIMETTVGSFAVKKGLAQMLKGGVIMDVVTPEHARIAEDAGAVAVMAL